MRTEIDEIIGGRSGEIYSELLGSITTYDTPHQFIETAYQQYLNSYSNNPSVNGRIFEYLVCETLARGQISPFYYQARFTLIPNADFDVVCYNPKRPVVLSMKVSLRERYKQADLEGIALRQVYRNAECYLVTLSNEEAKGVSRKIKEGDVSGLNKCVIANTADYTNLLNDLKIRQFFYAVPVIPITGRVFPVPMPSI